MKIIGFDGWTVGSHHFQRLVAAFKNKGLELTLLHLGSWGNDKGRPVEESIGPLHVRDISFYRGRSFTEILTIEKPDAVVFLSTDAFAHRAFNRYCRRLGVPTIHLFHGLQQLMDDVPLKSKAYQRLWLMRRHAIKLLRHFLPVYVRSLWETEASFSEWCRLVQDIAGRTIAHRPTFAADDSKTDKACAYIDSDVRYAIKKYGYLAENVIAIGNPDLLSFGMKAETIGSCISQPFSHLQDVMYLDTALIDYGSVHDSVDEFVQHISQTGKELSRQGRRLVFKPHPSTGPEITTAITKEGIEICSNKAFIKTLQRCCACITEPSSAALIPALMGMPLFLAQYGKLSGQVFGNLISSYPRAITLTNIRQFSPMLESETRGFDPERTKSWIIENTGPLPAEEMPDRLANVLLTMISNRRAA